LPDGRRVDFQPIWAEDVADCVMAALDGGAEPGTRHELAGPQTLSLDEFVRLTLRHIGRRRPLLHFPAPVARRALQAVETLTGPAAFATWDEAELLRIPLTSPRGTAGAEALGVAPKPMPAVLGVG
jgi:NADH dehydrogenase